MTDTRPGDLARYGRWLKRGVGEAFSAAIGSASPKAISPPMA